MRIPLAVALFVPWLEALAADTPIQDEQALRRAVERFEEVGGPLEPAAYAPGEPAAFDNAATPLLEAALLTPRDRDERRRLSDLSRKAWASWTVADVQAARELVAARGEVLSLLDRAAARPRSRFPIDYSQGTFANPPPLLRILDATRLAALSARVALADGDPAAACRDVERIGAVARALQGEPMLIAFLVGLAAERTQLEVAADVAASPAADEPTLNRVEASLLVDDPAEGARRAVALDFVALASRFVDPPRHEGLVADFLDHGSDLLEGAAGDWWESRGTLEAAAASARRCRRVDADDEATRRGITGVHEVLGTWTGPFSRAAATRAGRAVVAFSLEVRRRGLRDGVYPPDVTDDPATATPLSLTGRPLRVVPREDGSTTVQADGAEEAWLSQFGDDTPAPPFRVMLPPVTPPAPPAPAIAP